MAASYDYERITSSGLLYFFLRAHCKPWFLNTSYDYGFINGLWSPLVTERITSSGLLPLLMTELIESSGL